MEPSNYSLLRESLTLAILQKSTHSPNPATDLEDLSDFLDYLTQELYTFLPPPLQTAAPLSTTTTTTTTTLERLIPPLSTLPLSIAESLINYDIVPDTDDVEKLISRVLLEYIDAACTPPPEWTGTGGKKDTCEICGRAGVGITYHHLIPRSTHAKVLKRNWHPEVMLNSVAWLCRSCHSTVHRCASNEVLAREYYTVALLLEREDIQRWRTYASRQRYRSALKNR
ncbi:hypothetical protein C7212DRAFT_287610 [Tuber magnatum]|uniref:HNH domain-containing protein n=1 Tax=Tuber magnatum TaxID=42249 RepID=A0A317SBW1_9PEZI|nr:hypothetical protein C7212DRAFT_287610 [Tuber magnatum]